MPASLHPSVPNGEDSGQPAALPARSRETPEELAEDYQRVLELCEEYGLLSARGSIDTDNLKHALEDHARWSREIVPLDIARVNAENVMRHAVLRAERAEAALVAGEARLREFRQRIERLAEMWGDDDAHGSDLLDALKLLRRPPE